MTFQKTSELWNIHCECKSQQVRYHRTVKIFRQIAVLKISRQPLLIPVLLQRSLTFLVSFKVVLRSIFLKLFQKSFFAYFPQLFTFSIKFLIKSSSGLQGATAAKKYACQITVESHTFKKSKNKRFKNQFSNPRTHQEHILRLANFPFFSPKVIMSFMTTHLHFIKQHGMSPNIQVSVFLWICLLRNIWDNDSTIHIPLWRMTLQFRAVSAMLFHKEAVNLRCCLKMQPQVGLY